MSAFGSCTYLITEPRTKQCFTDCCSRERAAWSAARSA
jgi:hypothetical protein